MSSPSCHEPSTMNYTLLFCRENWHLYGQQPRIMKKLFTLLLLLASFCGFAQKITLALNLKQDSTYYLTTNANLTVVQDLPGQKQVISTIMSARVSHKVIAIRDSVYDMEVQYKRLNMSMEIGGKTMGFGSDDSLSSNPASKAMAGLLNKTFNITITKSGKVLEVKNLDKVFDAIYSGNTQISDAQKTQIKNEMQQTFGEKTMKTNFQDAFAVFPGRSVAVGETWQNKSSLESIISCNTVTTFSITDQQANSYQVNGTIAFTPNGDGGYKPFKGMMMRYDNISGTGTNKIKLDKTTGWITEAFIVKNMQGTVHIQDCPQVPGGITFAMSVAADLTVTN